MTVVASSNRATTVTTCQAHGAASFANLLVTKEDGAIVLNPHLANRCVLRLDEQTATDLHDMLGNGWDDVCPRRFRPTWRRR